MKGWKDVLTKLNEVVCFFFRIKFLGSPRDPWHVSVFFCWKILTWCIDDPKNVTAIFVQIGWRNTLRLPG